MIDLINCIYAKNPDTKGTFSHLFYKITGDDYEK